MATMRYQQALRLAMTEEMERDPNVFICGEEVGQYQGPGPLVLALGAEKLDGDDVYADPAGHPFCLIRRPGWAPPLPA